MLLTTTFNLAKLAGACGQGVGSGTGYDTISAALGGADNYGKDNPVNLTTVVDCGGLEIGVWCLCCTQQDSTQISRLLAASFAETVLVNFENYVANDLAPRNAIQAARDYANGLITSDELATAEAAALASALNGNPVMHASLAAQAARYCCLPNAQYGALLASDAAVSSYAYLTTHTPPAVLTDESYAQARDIHAALLISIYKSALG